MGELLLVLTSSSVAQAFGSSIQTTEVASASQWCKFEVDSMTMRNLLANVRCKVNENVLKLRHKLCYAVFHTVWVSRGSAQLAWRDPVRGGGWGGVCGSEQYVKCA